MNPDTLTDTSFWRLSSLPCLTPSDPPEWREQLITNARIWHGLITGSLATPNGLRAAVFAESVDLNQYECFVGLQGDARVSQWIMDRLPEGYAADAVASPFSHPSNVLRERVQIFPRIQFHDRPPLASTPFAARAFLPRKTLPRGATLANVESAYGWTCLPLRLPFCRGDSLSLTRRPLSLPSAWIVSTLVGVPMVELDHDRAFAGPLYHAPEERMALVSNRLSSDLLLEERGLLHMARLYQCDATRLALAFVHVLTKEGDPTAAAWAALSRAIPPPFEQARIPPSISIDYPAWLALTQETQTPHRSIANSAAARRFLARMAHLASVDEITASLGLPVCSPELSANARLVYYQPFGKWQNARSDDQATRAGLIPIGQISAGGEPALLPLNDFARHILVCGATGTGKTTWVCRMLIALAKAGIPWLVLESARSEYFKRLKNQVPNLRRITLTATNGSVAGMPLALDPIRIPKAADGREPDLIEHVNDLCLAFEAAMPLSEWLRLELWNGLFRFYEWSRSDPQNLPPRIRDLPPFHRFSRFFIDSYLPWSLRVATNESSPSSSSMAEHLREMQAIFRRRFTMLTLGHVGRMAYAAHDFHITHADKDPLEELLTTPAVLELDPCARDESKALIITLLVGRLRSLLRGRLCTLGPDCLRHLLVIEEAHRVFGRDTLRQRDSDLAGLNAPQAAIELLSQCLAELRAYGHGFCVVDQSPSALHPSVLSNCNLKIILNTMNGQDQDVLAASVGVRDPIAASFLGRLEPWEAIVSACRSSLPSRIFIPPVG
ncbi:MAG: ATP-binding protein [Verrucomicrobiales bacterium]|nr:ATP-binding protein [Verrucomicrobiales bacterium]